MTMKTNGKGAIRLTEAIRALNFLLHVQPNATDTWLPETEYCVKKTLAALEQERFRMNCRVSPAVKKSFLPVLVVSLLVLCQPAQALTQQIDKVGLKVTHDNGTTGYLWTVDDWEDGKLKDSAIERMQSGVFVQPTKPKHPRWRMAGKIGMILVKTASYGAGILGGLAQLGTWHKTP